MNTWALNPVTSQRVDIRTIGLGRFPILVVDDFYAEPHAVRAAALRSQIETPRYSYPGHGAVSGMSPEVLIGYLNNLTDPPLGRAEASTVDFSVFKPEVPDLCNGLKRPHVDANADVVVVIYLNLPEQCSGGTAFYRLRGTTFERFPNFQSTLEILGVLRLLGEDSLAAVAARVDATDAADGSFLSDSNEHWELSDLVEMRFNRLLAYDARLYHSLYLVPGTFQSTDPGDRRLTQNCAFSVQSKFWQFRPVMPDLATSVPSSEQAARP